MMVFLNKFKRIIFVTISIIVLTGIFYVYFQTGFLTIRTYKIIGVEDKYQKVLINRFNLVGNQKLYKFLPGNRVISYHLNDIKSIVKEVLPNTSSVSAIPVGLHSLEISVNSYSPLFKVGDNQAITKDGVIYTEIHDVTFFPALTYASSSVVNAQILSQISDILPKVTAALFKVQSINIDDNSDIYLTNTISSSTIRVPSSASMEKIWSNLVSAIDTEPLKSKLEKEKNHLEYLDTRFGNKVFYKFTNATSTAIIPSHDTTTTISTSTATTTVR